MSDPDVASSGANEKNARPFPASTERTELCKWRRHNLRDNTSRRVIVNSINGSSERHNYGALRRVCVRVFSVRAP